MSTAASVPQGKQTPQPVVTIFESYGSGAEAIGVKVAQALGLPFHAQAFSSEELEAQEEQREKEGVLTRVIEAMGAFSGGRDGLDVVFEQRDREQLVAQNNQVVLAAAAAGGSSPGATGR